MGKQHKDCPNLRVHQQQLHKNTSLKYLGDIVHESGKVNINLIERRAKAYAIFAEIRAILEDVPLGKYRVEVGLQLRQAMFINGVLFNSEVWHGLKPTDLDVLSVVDHQILKYICKAHSKTPTEFVYLETGAIPLPFIVASRRMIYLQNILKRQPEELLRRVFEAQKTNPTHGDFIMLVKEDFAVMKIPYDENAIIAMEETQYKEYIKKHVKETAFSHLKTIQGTHSKVNIIKYESFIVQPYLNNPNLTNIEVSQLIALRSHTLRGVKTNFSSWYKSDLSCPFKCVNSQDTQEHILLCKPLLDDLPQEKRDAALLLNYNDIYGNTNQQIDAVKVFSGLLESREELLQKAKSTSGLSLDAAPTGGISGLPSSLP